MRKAAAVFSEQPFGAPAWLPEGPSDILAQHLLMQHNSIADFDKKMEQVKFALNEQSRQTPDHAEQ